MIFGKKEAYIFCISTNIRIFRWALLGFLWECFLRKFIIATIELVIYKFKNIFPIVEKDMMRFLLGLVVSVVIALAVQNIDQVSAFFGLF